MSFDLTNKNISDTFQNLLQKTGSDGKLYDLVGNEVRDLTIDGTLTANSYVTSQSIVHTSSGSTAFGNSIDDTHQFSGSIHMSGLSGSNLINGLVFDDGQGKISGSIYHHGNFYGSGSMIWGDINGNQYSPYFRMWGLVPAGSQKLEVGELAGYSSGSVLIFDQGGSYDNPAIFYNNIGTNTPADAKRLGVRWGINVASTDLTSLGNDFVSSSALVVSGSVSLMGSTSHLKVDGNITASGGITASGNLILGDLGSSAYLSASAGQMEFKGTGEALLQVSGTISASTSIVVGNMTTAYISASAGNLTISGSGDAELVVEGNISSSGTTIYAKNTFGSSDTTPSVANGTYFETHASTQTLTTFDGGQTGQIIYVLSKADVTYDVTGTTLKCGTTDLVTADTDLTTWLFDGTNWTCIGFTDQSDDLS